MRKPLIAVTGDFDPSLGRYYLKQEYMDAIRLNGGVPVIVEGPIRIPEEWSGDREELIRRMPLDTEMLEAVDGVLFTGGDDLDPAIYGATAEVKNGEVWPLRDAYEVQLARYALAHDIPSLGLCRGIQLLAAAMEVPLIQDLVSTGITTQHQQKAPTWFPTHRVLMTPGSRLAAILGETAWVNSFHHQAIGPRDDYPFDITAVSEPDGVIEGLEIPDRTFFVGVQWHPERMMQDPKQRALFTAFIQAAGEHHGC